MLVVLSLLPGSFLEGKCGGTTANQRVGRE